MKKYNFVYETTFNNGLYYRGQHKTDDLNDNYFGSSKIVKDLVRNHPELNTQCKNSEQSKDRSWLSKQGERSVFVKKINLITI